MKILNKIINYSKADKETLVIEVGVGSGNLTKKIAGIAKHVVGYEIDLTLKPILNEVLKEDMNVTLIFDDFLKRDLKKDIDKIECNQIFVIANLPYYITTPIITKFIEEDIDIDKMIIMVQKEVGERLNAKPNTKNYNSLTVFINYFFDVTKLFDVSKNVFIPKPNVDSAIIQLKKKEKREYLRNKQLIFKLIRDAFQYKRKTIKNNLKDYDLNIIEGVLSKYNLDLSARAEQITIEQFIDIANNLK